jgi:hypothetical protein
LVHPRNKNSFDPDVLRWAGTGGLPDGHSALRPEGEDEPLDPSDPFYRLGAYESRLFAEAMRLRELSEGGQGALGSSASGPA